MPKPDKILRTRPLSEIPEAVAKLRRIALFHPEKISVKLPVVYCVCRKVDRGKMVQCDACMEWFHLDCLSSEYRERVNDDKWQCDWCTNGVDKEGYQRWKAERRKPKRRHQNDRPIVRGTGKGEEHAPQLLHPLDWEGKVVEVKELARRAAVKNRKLKVAAEAVVAGGGHHLTDTVGLAGLERRNVDDALIEEFLEDDLVAIPEEEDDD